MKYQAFLPHNLDKLPQSALLTAAQLEEIKVISAVLPFKTNNYVTDQLIDWRNAENDPMFRLTFPQRGMLEPLHYDLLATTMRRGASREVLKNMVNSIRFQLNPHPAGQLEHNVPFFEGERLEGIQHKYPQTVLVFPAQGQTCHAYCTFCFRWPQFVGMNELKFTMREAEQLVNYVRTHKKVTDVLFTGGDPMIMRTEILARYIDALLEAGIEHLQTIRIGTKALAFWPYRFTTDEDADDLLRLFERVVERGINLSVMAHFSHPVELSTDEVKKAIKRIRATGAQIRTQSPILKGINDKPEIWATMWREQVNQNCIPYYMFIPRDTGARHYFAVPLVKAWEVFRGAYQRVSGICRTVRGPSMSCDPGKVQLLGVSQIENNKVMVLRLLQGRNPDWVGRPFFARYDDQAEWFDELQPASPADSLFFNQLKKVTSQYSLS